METKQKTNVKKQTTKNQRQKINDKKSNNDATYAHVYRYGIA